MELSLDVLVTITIILTCTCSTNLVCSEIVSAKLSSGLAVTSAALLKPFQNYSNIRSLVECAQLCLEEKDDCQTVEYDEKQYCSLLRIHQPQSDEPQSEKRMFTVNVGVILYSYFDRI